MQDLTLVGLTEDGSSWSWSATRARSSPFPSPGSTRSWQRSRRPGTGGVSDRHHVRDAHTGHPEGQLDQRSTKMDSALRPRDIQARIRAGESPEDVAAAARHDRRQDHGLRRAGARRARPRRPTAPSVRPCAARSAEPASTARTLGDAAAADGSARRNVDPDVGRVGRLAPRGRPLDAGRRRTAHDGERPARRVRLRRPGRYVVADDDEARWLVGEASPPAAGPQPRRPPRRRADAGCRGTTTTSCRSATTRSSWSARTAARRGPGRPRPPRPPPSPTRSPATPTGSPPRPRAAATVEPLHEPEPEVDGPERGARAARSRRARAEPASPSRPRAREEEPSRASVPSWDEIMFGGGKSEPTVRTRSLFGGRPAGDLVPLPRWSAWPTSSPARPASSAGTSSRSSLDNREGEIFVLVREGSQARLERADPAAGAPTGSTPVVGDLGKPTGSASTTAWVARAPRRRSTTSSTSPRSTT